MKGEQLLTRFHVGGRVIKTAVAVTLSIYLAQQLGLERVTLAAIVALVTVQRTFYNSLLESLGRLGSVMIGGILGTLFAYFLGAAPLAYGLVTLLSISICLQLRLQNNIILTTITAITVIISNADNLILYSLSQIATALLGAIVALLINYLFTPNHQKEVVRQVQQAEEGLRQLIDIIMKEMLHPGCETGEFKNQVLRLKQEIKTGKDTAILLQEEQRFVITRETPSDCYLLAFDLFDSQLDRLEEMHNLARRIAVEVPQAAHLVQLFRIVQQVQRNRIRGKKSSNTLLDRVITNLDQRFARLEMPRTREEFVSRASLFHLYQEIKRYYRYTLKLPETPGVSLKHQSKSRQSCG